MNEKKLKGGIFNRVSDTNLLFIITVVIFFLMYFSPCDHKFLLPWRQRAF